MLEAGQGLQWRGVAEKLRLNTVPPVGSDFARGTGLRTWDRETPAGNQYPGGDSRATAGRRHGGRTVSPLGVVSLTYSHVPLSTLERVAYGADDVPPRLEQLVQLPKVWEAAMLSTCKPNRDLRERANRTGTRGWWGRARPAEPQSDFLTENRG